MRQYIHASFPMYKYTKREYAKKFFEKGILRIGTLYGYADSKKYSGGIYDGDEGVYAVTSTHNGVISYEAHSSRNAYLFCASSVYSPDLYDDFGADFCFRINDIQFYHELSKSFERECEIFLLAPVSYVSKSFWKVGEGLPRQAPGLVKDRDLFQHQAEIRAAWEPPGVERHLDGKRDSVETMAAVRADAATEAARLTARDIHTADAARYCTPIDSF